MLMAFSKEFGKTIFFKNLEKNGKRQKSAKFPSIQRVSNAKSFDGKYGLSSHLSSQPHINSLWLLFEVFLEEFGKTIFSKKSEKKKWQKTKFAKFPSIYKVNNAKSFEGKYGLSRDLSLQPHINSLWFALCPPTPSFLPIKKATHYTYIKLNSYPAENRHRIFENLFYWILYVPSSIFQLNRDESSWVETVLS